MFSRNEKRHYAARRASALTALLCLSTALLFLGCQMEEEDNSTLINTWESSFGEKWIISDTGVSWEDGYGGSYIAAIRNNPDFTQKAGVIIIEYTDKTPKYYDYDNNGTMTGGPYDPPGNFTALYWKELSADSVKLANAWGSLSDYSHNGAPEKATLNEAAATYTLAAENQYVGAYSTCEKN